MLPLPTKAAAMAAAVACCLAAVQPARASGTLNIHHQNGSINTYRDVEIKVLSGALFVTSDDGDGTLVVSNAACSYQGKIIVCLPTAVAVVQGGSSHALDLKSGTIYVNYTDSDQAMSRSTTKLPARNIMLAFSTKRGTSVTLTGRIDQVIKQ
ncbi:MAG TPA: hypothetical protein VHR97_02890 [Candidatus Baltobacteraceae bacterium]|jgi:DUF4097 and DUF4098 domain-containing protein YvlB|nr:hypothetical protein [Candidatus Baltobacteraceae bacterium]